MTTRRDFLKLSLGALAGTAIGDEALEFLDRMLPRKKYVNGADFGFKEYKLGLSVSKSQFEIDKYVTIALNSDGIFIVTHENFL